MKLASINSISFRGKIIDAHAHIGNWNNSTYNTNSLDTFIRQPLDNGDTIERILVSNLSCIDQASVQDEISGNIEMLNAAQRNPKIAPLAVCQPKTGSVENIEKLFEEHPGKFVGLKFHPDGHKIMANDSKIIPYLKFAKEKKLPCLFHCGIDWENAQLVDASRQFSHPQKIYEAAQKIPDTPVILAHLGAGGPKVHKEATKVLLDSITTDKAKLYADISWVDIDNPDKPTIVNLIKKLKIVEKNGKTFDYTDRLLFGSDAPIGEFATGKDGLSGKEFYNKTVSEIKTAIRNNFGDNTEELIDKIFYQNAEKLFFNKKQQITNSIEPTIKKVSKTKIGMIIGGVLLTIGVIAGLAAHKNKTKNSQTICKMKYL